MKNTMNIRGQLFNLLPTNIRNIALTKVDVFKKQLEKFLQKVPAPSCDGYLGLQTTPSNSPLSKVITRQACPQTGLGE